MPKLIDGLNTMNKTQQAVNIINKILKLDYNKLQLISEKNIQVNVDNDYSLLLSDIYIVNANRKETKFVYLYLQYKEKFINKYCISELPNREDMETLLKSVELLFINVKLYLYQYAVSNLIEMSS